MRKDVKEKSEYLEVRNKVDYYVSIQIQEKVVIIKEKYDVT